MITVKQCNKCGETHPANGFYTAKDKRRGSITFRLNAACKQCDRKRAADFRALNPPKPNKKFRSKEYRRAERMRAAERAGKKYTTRDELTRRAIERGAKQVDHHVKKYRKRMAQIEQAKDMPWLHPDLTRAERFRVRYNSDPEFNLLQRTRSALRRKRQGIRLDTIVRCAIARDGRSPTAEQFLGYTMKELREHLERQFKRGMDWQKFIDGKIHIDHIVPLSSFDLSDPDELRTAWAMTNLRPLWAEQNLRKSAKMEFML